MLRLLYSALLYVIAPLALAATALRGLRDPSYRDRLPERYGFTRLRFMTPPIWIHAVSVGEVQAATPLVRALTQRHPQHPILVTTATPTGAQRVRTLFGDSVRHAYLPYDLPGAVRRFLASTTPALAIVMTTVAMVAGMLPVAIGLHGDSSFRAPMAIAVIGGLLTSTALTLVIVPAVFTLIDDAERWVQRRLGRDAPAAPASPPVRPRPAAG
jgi:hypothetical protein